MELPNFSIDLISAFQRNGGFFKNKSTEELEGLLKEYKLFWRIIRKYPDVSFCPTESIDEVWHLHMLHPQNYYYDCLEYFDVILAHEAGFGKFEEEIPVLNEIFDAGNDVWEKEYGYRLPEIV